VLGPATGVLDWTESGSCVVVFRGTLDSGVLENTDRLSADRSAGTLRGVMARLPLVAGLIGWVYWYTT
jgi:hypothetical protein